MVEVCTIRIPVPKNDKDWTFICEPLSDIHIGPKQFAETEFRRHVERIRQEKRYTILLGDLCDCIFPVPGEKRFDIDSMDPRVLVDREYGVSMAEKEYEMLYEMLLPIKKRIIAVMTGNHDDIMRTKCQKDWVKDIATRFHAKYMGFGGFIRIYFTNGLSNEILSQLTIRAIHGAYIGNRIGGAINRLEDAARHWEADVYLTGHDHQVGGSIQEYSALDDENNIVERKRVFAKTGSFYKGYLKGYSSYVELKDKPPTRVGTITFEYNPRSHALYLHQ